MSAITISNLTKRFGDITAVDDLSLEIEYGELFGILGPNGAGKSTTVNVLNTLLEPTSGSAVVDGHDVVFDPGSSGIVCVQISRRTNDHVGCITHPPVIRLVPLNCNIALTMPGHQRLMFRDG